MAYSLDALYALVPLAVYWIIKYMQAVHLQGPPSPGFVFGHTKQITESSNPAELYDRWAQTYGGVFQVRGPLGTIRLVVCDPRALSHVLVFDSKKYSHPPLAQLQITSLVCCRSAFGFKLSIHMVQTGPGNLLVAIGDVHARLVSCSGSEHHTHMF